VALTDLGATRTDGQSVDVDELNAHGAPMEFSTPKGKLMVVPEPAGTRGGYDDLRRAATREPIGKGLRPSFASTADLARMLAALGREDDMPKLIALRRLQRLERSLGPELGL
jgi:hypothetical protein